MCIRALAEGAAAAVEFSKYVDGGAGLIGVVRAAILDELKARFVDEVSAENLGVAELQRLLGLVRAVSPRGESESADSLILLVILKELVARCERVAGSQLPVDARADIGAEFRGAGTA